MMPPRTYRSDIDGLRAIAIISVVAFHARIRFVSGGFAGVDVFLAISGYLIGGLVLADVSAGTFTIARFYARRAKRILPALFTVLLFLYTVGYLLLSPAELRHLCLEAVAALCSSGNIYYWIKSGYFAPGAEFRPLLMTWSLGVEEQFYLLFPLVLVLLHKYARPVFRQALVLLTLLSLLCSAACAHVWPTAAFYLIPMRAWELGIGVIAAVYEVRHDDRKTRLADVSGWVGLGMILISVFAYGAGTKFAGVAALLPTLGTVCLISAPASYVNRRLLSSRPMVWIGLISYSWYLWHWPLLSLASIITGGPLSPRVAIPIAVLSMFLAVLSYQFIEQPFRQSTTATTPLLGRYATLVALFAVLPIIGLRGGLPDRLPQLVPAEAAVRDVERNTCLAGYGTVTPVTARPCVLNGEEGKLVLLGDSHAASLGSAIAEVAARNGYGFEELTKSSCPPLATVTRRMASHPAHETECAAFNRAVFDRVLHDGRVTVVVLAGYWSAPLMDGGDEDRYVRIAEPRKEISEEQSCYNLKFGLRDTIALLRSSGKRVMVATDAPRFGFDPVRNLRNVEITGRRSIAKLLSAESISLQPLALNRVTRPADAATDDAVRQAAAEGGARILDVRHNLCRNSGCRFWLDGTLLYADSQHLTLAGAEYALNGEELIFRRAAYVAVVEGSEVENPAPVGMNNSEPVVVHLPQRLLKRRSLRSGRDDKGESTCFR